MQEERAFWVAWSKINGVGPILLRRLHKHFGTLSAAWEASLSALVEVDGVGVQSAESVIVQRRAIQPEALLEVHEQENPGFWTPADADYPALLLEITDLPPVLYYRGIVNPSELDGSHPMVAMVGTRSPSEYGRRWTRRISETLTQSGFTIVSGLADGIDTEAHRSCLAAGGRTIAVLGCGVDIIYPWSNRGLYQQILKNGLVLSEHPAGTQPDRTFFPRRNRIIAGLSRATLVMEAPAKSGGLITAHYANEYGRDVYALPGSLDNPKSLGCIKLINKGAMVIEGEQELLDALGTLPSLQQKTNKPPIQASLPLDLAPELAHLLQILTDLPDESGSVQFDRLVQAANQPASVVSSSLLQLELTGLVTQLPGMRYQRS